jgi:uncharacterized protein (DUF924 family)
MRTRVDEVLEFWFGREDEPGYGEFREAWFRKDPEFDHQVRDRFEALHEEAFDRELPDFQRMFLYMPLMHSEDLEHQRRSVELFRALGGSDAAGYAVRHMEIIERFGRFPHRNEVLGRQTTPEEAEFLTQPGSSF